MGCYLEQFFDTGQSRFSEAVCHMLPKFIGIIAARHNQVQRRFTGPSGNRQRFDRVVGAGFD